jgi:hypothetical protein
VPLTIPDSKPYIKFFGELNGVINNLENKPIYQHLAEKVPEEFIP